MTIIRVLMVDDHTIMRIGMRNLLINELDIELVGEATNGEQALQMVRELSPNVLLLDMEMPGISGIEVAQRLYNEGSSVYILALSAHNDRKYIESVLKSGASGYLVKDEAPEAIVDAVRGVAQGEKGWFSRRIASKLFEWVNEKPTSKGMLTQREHQVIQVLLPGKTNQEIGCVLGISEKTVEKHMEAIFQKLGIGSRTEAAVWAAQEAMGKIMSRP